MLKKYISSLLLLISCSLFANQHDHLFDNPTYLDVQISPNGSMLAVKAEVEGKFILIFIDNNKNKVVNMVSLAGNQEVGAYGWVNNERVVINVMYRKPWLKQLVSYGELFAINFDGKKSEMIYGYQNANSPSSSNIKKKKGVRGWASILDMLPEDDNHILISSKPWDGGRDSLSTVYKLNVYSGKLARKVAKAPISHASFVADVNGKVVVSTGIDKNNKQQVFLKDGKGWKQLPQTQFGENFTPLTIGESGKYLYLLDNYKQDKVGLFKFNLETHEHKHIFTDQNVDISNVSRTTDKRSIYALKLDDGHPEYVLINKNLREAQIFKSLTQTFSGMEIDILSHTKDGEKFVIRVSSDREPGIFYLYDVAKNEIKPVFKYYPNIDSNALKPMQPVEILSSDNKKISAYLTQGTAPKDKLAPLVLMVHGGPHARDYWGFSPQVQYLAANGFSVLQVNFRGSTGYGQDYLESGYEHWGSTIQRDIYESYLWAVENNYVDKGNVCIMGASFGGYSAIQSSIKYPDVYQCAVANAGVYDLPLLFSEGDVKDLNFGKSYLEMTLGNVKTMHEFSPVNHVKHIKANLLLAHGEKDERAPFEHVKRLKTSLDKINKPYEWFVKEKESHGFHDPVNQKAYMGKVVSFLNAHLNH